VDETRYVEKITKIYRLHDIDVRFFARMIKFLINSELRKKNDCGKMYPTLFITHIYYCTEVVVVSNNTARAALGCIELGICKTQGKTIFDKSLLSHYS
jgi:hypothetical protein